MSLLKNFSPDGRATLIGSLPLADYEQAIDLIFEHTPHIPLWPQLPLNKDEGGMLCQFSENIPGYSEAGGRAFFDSSAAGLEEQQLAFFEEYLPLAEDFSELSASRFITSERRAPGLYRLVERLKSSPPADCYAVKGQLTGPFTLLTGLKDQAKQDAWYDPMIHEMVVKAFSLRAAWQTLFLASSGLSPIVFLDEPALAGLGSSAYISVSQDEIKTDINEIIAAIHQAGGLSGIHVCANTDWEFVLSLDLDILSFDAYGYFDRLAGCRKALYSFLERGGIIAWGLVPTAEEEDIKRETVESLLARWEAQSDQIGSERWTKAELLRRTIISPSCGTGALSPELATRVLALTGGLSAALREKYL